MINKNMSKKEIIDKIAFLMSQKNISAYSISRKLGHSSTYFYRIESGDINLTVDTLLDVLEILDITTYDFFSSDLDNLADNCAK